MTLGEKIKEARVKAGYTQEQFAVMLGVSRQAVTKWEADRGMPDVDNLKLMGQLLGISVDYLLDDGTELDLSVTREAVDLTNYEGSKFDKKVNVLLEKFPDAECHPLVSTKKLSKSERLLDEAIGWLTDLSFGSVELAKAFDDMNEQFFLVEDEKDQYLVHISDEFIETRKLATHIEKNKKKGTGYGRFEIGDREFRDGGIIDVRGGLWYYIG